MDIQAQLKKIKTGVRQLRRTVVSKQAIHQAHDYRRGVRLKKHAQSAPASTDAGSKQAKPQPPGTKKPQGAGKGGVANTRSLLLGPKDGSGGNRKDRLSKGRRQSVAAGMGGGGGGKTSVVDRLRRSSVSQASASTRAFMGAVERKREQCIRSLQLSPHERAVWDIKHIESWLKEVQILGNLPKPVLNTLARQMRVRGLEDGEVLFHQGDEVTADEGAECYIVIEGSMAVFINDEFNAMKDAGETFVEWSRGSEDMYGDLLATMGPKESVGDRVLLLGQSQLRHSKKSSADLKKDAAKATDASAKARKRSSQPQLSGKSGHGAFRRAATAIAQATTVVAVLDKQTWDQATKGLDGKDGVHAPGAAPAVQKLVVLPPQLLAVLDLSPDERSAQQLRYMVEYLCQYRFFQQLPTHALFQLVKGASLRLEVEGNTVCKQGDVGDAFYIIMKGTIAVHVKSQQQLEEEQKAAHEQRKRQDEIAAGIVSPKRDGYDGKGGLGAGGDGDGGGAHGEGGGKEGKEKEKEEEEDPEVRNERLWGTKVCELREGDTFGERALLASSTSAAAFDHHCGVASEQLARTASTKWNPNAVRGQKVPMGGGRAAHATLRPPDSDSDGLSEESLRKARGMGSKKRSFVDAAARRRQTRIEARESRSGRRAATLVCATDVRLVRITRSQYDTVLKQFQDQLEFGIQNCLAALQIAPRNRSPQHVGLLLRFVRHHPKLRIFFGQLPYTIREHVCMAVKLRVVRKGEAVFKEGDDARMFYIVMKGSVGIYQKHADAATRLQEHSGPASPPPGMRKKGKQATLPTSPVSAAAKAAGHLVVELMEGDSFGHTAFLNGRQRNATVVALGDRAARSSGGAGLAQNDDRVELLTMPRRYFYLTIARLAGKIVFSPGAALHLIRRTRPGLRDAEQLEVMARYMKSHRFFAQFPHSRLTKFAKVLHHVKIPSGQALCHQGDDSDGFYVLLSGVVTVHILTPDIQAQLALTGDEMKAKRAVSDAAMRMSAAANFPYCGEPKTCMKPVEMLAEHLFQIERRLRCAPLRARILIPAWCSAVR